MADKNADKVMKILMKRYADENPDEMRKFSKEVAKYEKSKVAKKAAKKAAKKGAKKGIAKKVISKLGWPGKVAIGAWTAYDIAKDMSAKKSKGGKGKSCKVGSYMNKKGVCVSERRAKK
jgi:TctA family transporter|tara:strand:+ start:326 stop:682 length:357 start_codon:yes stop_codon:yes gene_type:complete